MNTVLDIQIYFIFYSINLFIFKKGLNIQLRVHFKNICDDEVFTLKLICLKYYHLAME